MTKKDYQLTANKVRECLKLVHEFDSKSGKYKTYPPIHEFARQLSTSLQNDNPRFDREKFMKACGF